jgi:hypothetical protein
MCDWFARQAYPEGSKNHELETEFKRRAKGACIALRRLCRNLNLYEFKKALKVIRTHKYSNTEWGKLSLDAVMEGPPTYFGFEMEQLWFVFEDIPRMTSFDGETQVQFLKTLKKTTIFLTQNRVL